MTKTNKQQQPISINFSKEIPPVYEKCKEQFEVDWDKGVIITYGDTIYCKYDITPDKIAHEVTHIFQQFGIKKEDWWEQYLTNDRFRKEMEIEAYKNEFDWVYKNIKCKNKRFQMANNMALDLSGYMYGNMMTRNEALVAINYRR